MNTSWNWRREAVLFIAHDRASLIDWKTSGIALAAFLALRWKIDLLWIVAAVAVVSVVIF